RRSPTCRLSVCSRRRWRCMKRSCRDQPPSRLEFPGFAAHIPLPEGNVAVGCAISLIALRLFRPHKETTPIRRPMQTPPVKDGPRMNQEIRAPRVLLIDQNGEKQGVMPTSSALEAAEEAGLDLVEIVATSDPPVAKILDYGKFRFQEQK